MVKILCMVLAVAASLLEAGLRQGVLGAIPTDVPKEGCVAKEAVCRERVEQNVLLRVPIKTLVWVVTVVHQLIAS